MQKSILFALLCGIAVFAVACGSGNNSKGNGSTPAGNGGKAEGTGGGEAADPYALYKKKGRVWVLRTESDTGGTKSVSHMKTEVVEVADDKAMIKTWMLGEDMKPMAGMPEPAATPIPFAKADATAPKGDAPKVDIKEEKVTVKAGDFECIVTEMETSGIKTKSWSSKKYPGLTVKSESAGETAGMKMSTKMELIEFKD